MCQSVRMTGCMWLLMGILAAGTQATARRPAPSGGADSTATQESRIACFRLDGEIPEVLDEVAMMFSRQKPVSMDRWLRRLAKARNDPTVSAVVLEIADLQAGWAQVQELRGAIGRLRDAGKPVYGYLGDAGFRNYVLATACDRIAQAPAAHLDVSGLVLEVWFYKGLMDKLGVQADILHVGAYKGAGEPYTRTGPSEELKSQLNELLDGLHEQLVATIARGRSLEADEVRRLIDVGMFSANDAARAGLVDRVAPLQDFLADLEDEHDAVLAEDYAGPSGSLPDMSNPFALFKIFTRAPGATAGNKPAVGLIFLSGLIVDREEDGLFGGGTVTPDEIDEAVTEALDDDNVKAVVVRIDSPGGSALASDFMYGHLRRLAEEKPVVVSMGNVAASGGYYVAAAGPVILAEPGTITGSIGVLGGKVALRGLLDKVGITTYSVSRGQMAGMFDMLEPFTPAQRERVLAMMNDVYQTFLDRVLATRREKITEPIDQVAGGRVFTGQQALNLGLVDRLGGMTEAVYLAAEQAGLKAYEIRVVPKPKSFFESLLEGFLSRAGEDARALQPVLGSLLTGGTDPSVAAMRRIALRALRRVHLLRRWPVLLLMPYDTNLVP